MSQETQIQTERQNEKCEYLKVYVSDRKGDIGRMIRKSCFSVYCALCDKIELGCGGVGG